MSGITMKEFLNWLGNYWWVLVVGWMFLAGSAEGIAESFGAGLRQRHRRRMKELRVRLAIAEARRQPAALDPKPGECVHRNVTPVVDDDEVVAWLCRSCDTQLPATWAVRKEDL